MKRIRKVKPKPEKLNIESNSTSKVARAKPKSKKSASVKPKAASTKKTQAKIATSGSNGTAKANANTKTVGNDVPPTNTARVGVLSTTAPLTAAQMDEIVNAALSIVMSRPTTPEGMQRKTNVLLKLQVYSTFLSIILYLQHIKIN